MRDGSKFLYTPGREIFYAIGCRMDDLKEVIDWNNVNLTCGGPFTMWIRSNWEILAAASVGAIALAIVIWLFGILV